MPKLLTGIGLASVVLLLAVQFASNDVSGAPASNASSNGSWGPNIALRAPVSAYSQFPKVMMRPDPPADGWFISPIHANLLSSGDVVITGWARPQEHECPSHTGRQWPASFIVHVSPDYDVPVGSVGSQLYINPIDENGEKKGGRSTKDQLDVLYCAGHAPLPDGKILYTGGARYVDLEFNKTGDGDPHEFEDEYGLNYARIFDPKTKSFHRVKANYPDGPSVDEVKRIETATGKPSREWSAIYKKGMRWYPTNLRLPDGKQLITGGFARESGPFDPQFVNRSLVIFDPKKADSNPWTIWVPHKELSGPDPSEVLNLTGFDYVHMFLLPRPAVYNGRSYQVAVMGGAKGEYGLLTLDPRVPPGERILVPPSKGGSEPVRPAGKNAKAPGASDTTGLILPGGEIVMVGGGYDGREGAQRIDVYDPYSNTWRQPIYTGVSRIRAASILLPTGEVLILNGEESYTDGSNIGDRRQPILFDPETNQIHLLDAWADDTNDRGYHNFAILLKDARILLGGGRELVRDEAGLEIHRIGCERTDLRIYSPPYLFNGVRPVIQANQPISMKIGGSTIKLPYEGEALKSAGGVVLMALPSETHHFDQNQRMVVLRYELSRNQIQIHPPESHVAAPVGDYTMYFVTDKNVPSSGVSVHVE